MALDGVSSRLVLPARYEMSRRTEFFFRGGLACVSFFREGKMLRNLFVLFLDTFCVPKIVDFFVCNISLFLQPRGGLIVNG